MQKFVILSKKQASLKFEALLAMQNLVFMPSRGVQIPEWQHGSVGETSECQWLPYIMSWGRSSTFKS